MSGIDNKELGHSELKKVEADPLYQDSTEPDWFLYDNQGLILPHSILGSLEDFRSYVLARGKTALLKKMANSSQSFGILEKHASNVVRNKSKIPSGLQTNALEHWNSHMRLRRQQQDSLSGLLHRPVKNLLMNHASRFRETQEKREMLNQVLPLVHSGYGHCVGSGFWRLPQRYGDETSGITATLTKTERGLREPSAQVGLPYRICQESGIRQADTVRHASRAWDQSIYLKQQCQWLSEVIQDVAFKRPDLDKLEVTGSCKPLTTVSTCSSASVEKRNNEEGLKDLQEDIMPQSNDVESESKDLFVPALRVSGQLAYWTGNSNTNQGHVGISATVFFECPTGELQVSNLKLHNEGSTAIFYSWQQLPLPHHFPHLLSATKRPHFYSNSSSGVILPGDTQKVEIIFKSDKPGIHTELWQLNTCPVLLQSASIQVTLRGVALHQDKNADLRQYIETKLENIVTVKICRSIVYEMVKGIHTPERPSSPEEPYQTEEQEFLCKNPKLCYINQPVENLKKLWCKAKPESTWDFSISTLQQALLSLPDNEVADDFLTRETGLAQLNSLVLQLSEPLPKQHSPSVATIGQLLWRDLLDTMTSEAVRLRHLFNFSEKDTWIDKKEEVLSDHDETGNVNEKRIEKRGGTSTKGAVAKSKKDSATPVKRKEFLTQDNGKKGRSHTDLGKQRNNKEAASTTGLHLQSEHKQASEDLVTNMKHDIYSRLLHQKVFGLMENLVDSLCDLTEEMRLPTDTAATL